MSTMSTTPTGSRVGVLVAGLGAAALLALGLAPAAQAHNTLISSSPKDEATLDTVPEEMLLTFNDTVNEGGNGIVVTGPDGTDHADGEVLLDGPNASVALTPLTEAGEYTVDYRIISADGHPLEDSLTFTLDEAAVPEPVESEEAPTPQEEDVSPSPAANEVPADPMSPTGALGPVVGVVGAIGAVALVAILVIRLRRRDGGDGSGQ